MNWLISLLLIINPSFTFAKNPNFADHQNRINNMSLSELKANFVNEVDSNWKFATLARIIKIYSSERLVAENLSEAKKFADICRREATHLSDHWDAENGLFFSHIVLGRIALQSKDIKLAIQELKAAGESKGSPQLNSFGPNMILAKELLIAGEKESVKAFIKNSLRYWKNEGATKKSAQWIQEIDSGKIPDFDSQTGLSPSVR